MKLKTICFDIDNVICKTNARREYSKSTPIKKNIKVMPINNNSNTFFNGCANQGKVISKSKKLPTGTYFYKLQFKQEGNEASLTRTGYLYLTH